MIQKTNKIYLTYESRETGGDYEPGQFGAYGNREDSHVSFYLVGAYMQEKDWQETVSVSFDPKTVDQIYVVVVRYTTGNTFGRTYGMWHIEGAYDNYEEANNIVNKISNEKYDGYCPWKGYFEALESANVFTMELSE